MSDARAVIAWGIDFGDPVNTTSGLQVLAYGQEGSLFPRLFGFTEAMPLCPAELTGDARLEWWRSVRDPWTERMHAAVPLTFEHYGYERQGTALVLRRSVTVSEWAAIEVNPDSLAPPTDDELAAFRMVLAHLGHDVSAPKLLLLAEYG